MHLSKKQKKREKKNKCQHANLWYFSQQYNDSHKPKIYSSFMEGKWLTVVYTDGSGLFFKRKIPFMSHELIFRKMNIEF